jgi:NAD(P)-dependent dehydrogenase (short-subunit alcohol dehydrogenase family)
MKLENRIAIVTGAAKGMGDAITATLAREGADVMLTAREIGPLEETAQKVRAMGRRAEITTCDVTDESQVKAMVDRTLAAFGARIDILVNVAGVTGPIETPVWEIARDDFEYVIKANILGMYLPIKHVLPTMIRQKRGKIVNIGGSSGIRGYRNRAAYSSSKWAVRGLTRTVALDVGEYGINVNNIVPGIVETPRMERLCREKARKRGWTYEQVYQEYVDDTTLRSITTPKDIANAVLFAASDDSRNMTGQDIIIDGGWQI